MTATSLADYNFFDYERVLAARELDALVASAHPRGLDPSHVLRERSTFFGAIEGVPTVQAVTENLHHRERGSSPSRQATRYLVHGLHEYKGKFNPQMARALINTIDPTATALLDPYCGSGTTLVEGLRLGLQVAGVDKNPLAAWIASTKVTALGLSGRSGTVAEFERLADQVLSAAEAAQGRAQLLVPAAVDDHDADYLLRWFPEQVLAALWAAVGVCAGDGGPTAEIAKMCISNIVRQVSWQLPEDLRVRRRPAGWVPPAVDPLLRASFAKARRALAEVEQATPIADPGVNVVRFGSSTDRALVADAWPAGRRLAVTSPPYATALPYIDTDRLSIVLLGLSSAKEIRRLEQGLTGSREWNTSEAADWMRTRLDNGASLPDTAMDIIERIEQSNAHSSPGFRRRALPALLYRYFAQIGGTLDSLKAAMSPGERVVMVVGTNRTGAGDDQIVIPTPSLIGDLAAARGFEFTELIPLETWARYGMHSRNAVNGEEAVVMTVKS